VKKVKGGKVEGESCWKAAGDERVFIPSRGSGWQIRAGSDAILANCSSKLPREGFVAILCAITFLGPSG
jgi:hypothetical protein